MYYQFALLDPRNIPAATAANEAVFSLGPVYGIEVTVPALAARCKTNLDPQHSGQNGNLAAIEGALTAELPPTGAILATVRPDLDAIGTMAVFSIRAEGVEFDSDGMERIRMVAESDRFSRGGYSGPKALPTRKNPWDESVSSVESSRPLAAIAACVMDFKVPIATRVAKMESWILTGDDPVPYRDTVEAERLGMITALETGEIKYETRCAGKIAVIRSTHRSATMVGYALAPVVIAANPNFSIQGGPKHLKYTICQFDGSFVDLKACVAELTTLEAGWGGSPTIIGSPQGISSEISIDELVAIVEKHLK